MPDDRVPIVRFAPVRRRVPLPPHPGAAMTAALLIVGVWAVVIVFAFCIGWVSGDADRRIEEMRRKERRLRRGPGGWRH